MDQALNYIGIPPSTSFNFGNGFVEVGALTTLIGSTVAAELVLGGKGPAGLVWGTVCAFGTASVIKACACAACPGWLRQIFGLRTTVSDREIGMDLSLSPDSKVARMARSRLESPLGISCNAEDLDHAKNGSRLGKEHHSCRDIYVFDPETRLLLEGLTPTSTGSPLTVYTFYNYPCFRTHNNSFQMTLLALSLLKYLESLVLFKQGVPWMALLSAVPFTFFLLTAVCLEISEITACRRPMDIDGHVDIVAGITSTTVDNIDGQRKVVLGAMKNQKSSLWWKFIWIMAALLHTASLLISYILLSQQSTQVVLTWAAFQITWLLLRLLISVLADTSETMVGRPMQGHQLDALPRAMKLRVVNLALGIAKYQTHSHPRGLPAYSDDSFSAHQISTILATPNLRKDYMLPQGDNKIIQLNIHAVIGDTTLWSVAWVVGSTLTSLDLYDSCIVVLSSPISKNHPRCLTAIPAVRVYSQIPAGKDYYDSETAEPIFIPRGAGGGPEVKVKQWMFWVPCSSGQWLHFKTPNMSVLGKRTAEVMTDAQVTKMLSAGNLNISLKEAEELKAIIDVTRKAANHLLSVLNYNNI